MERPKGDAMPKTVVSTLYNFRDIKDKEDDAKEDAQNEKAGGGGGRGGGRRGRRKSSASTSAPDNKLSASATRRYYSFSFLGC